MANNQNSPERRFPIHIEDDLSNDDAEYYDAWRQPAAHHVIYHRNSPLDELATGTARLNIQNSVDSFLRSPSSVAPFPSFEDLSVRSASNVSGLSLPEVQQQTSSRTQPSSSNAPEVLIASPTASSVPASPSSTAAERLRAFAESFSPLMRRMSPQRRQDLPVVISRQGSSAAPNSLAATRGAEWTPANPSVQSNRPRLTELAIGRSSQSFGAPSLRPTIASTSRRTMLDEEQENNDDMSELEEEARAYHERMESALLQNDRIHPQDREDRTPPRQGRFMRFLGRN